MIHLYVGMGKGKTTAATGLIVRNLGYDKPCLLVPFLKDGTSGELNFLRKQSLVTILDQHRVEGFYTFLSPEAQLAFKANQLALFEEVLKTANNYQLIVLDEILDLIGLNIIDEPTLIAFIKAIDKDIELVLTGHQVSDNLIELSDYYTNFECIKHPFQKGIQARESIEY